MLDSRGHVVLIDLGLTRPIAPRARGATVGPLGGVDEEQPLSPMGSLAYMAPELLSSQVGGRCTDWWALGILAYELMTGQTPWASGADKRALKKEIMATKVMPHRRLSPAAGMFICALLKRDPRERLGCEGDAQVKRHEFFKPVDWEACERQGLPPALGPVAPGAFRDPKGRDEAALEIHRKAAHCQPKPRGNEWYLGLDRATQGPVEASTGSSSL